MRKLLLGSAALVAAVLAGPLVFATVDGLSSEILGERANAAGRLLSAYRQNVPPRKLANYDVPAVDQTPTDCGYTFADVYASAGEQRQEDELWFESAWQSEYVRQLDAARLRSLEQVTTRFGRTFLADCLAAPGYRQLCLAYAGRIRALDDDYIDARMKRDTAELTARLSRVRCAYFDGIRAARLKLPFIPKSGRGR